MPPENSLQTVGTFLQVAIPLFIQILKAAPNLIDDVKRLRDALRSHPDPTIRPGAVHLDKVLDAVSTPKPERTE